MTLSLTLGLISVHAAVAVRNTDGSTGSRTTKEGVLWWLAFYIPGLVVGLTGLASLAKNSWASWRKSRTPIIVTGIFIGATLVIGAFAIFLYRRRRKLLKRAELRGRQRTSGLPASYSVHELLHIEQSTLQMLEDECVSSQMDAGPHIPGYKLLAFYDELYVDENPLNLSGGISQSPGSESNYERVLEEDTQPLQHDGLQSLNLASASLSDKILPTEYAQELPGSEGQVLGSCYRSYSDLRRNAEPEPHEQIRWGKQLVSSSFGNKHVTGRAESILSGSLSVNRSENSSKES